MKNQLFSLDIYKVKDLFDPEELTTKKLFVSE